MAYADPGQPGGPGGHGAPGNPGGGGPGGPGDHGPGVRAGLKTTVSAGREIVAPAVRRLGMAMRSGDFHDAPWGDGPAPWGPVEPPRPDRGRPLPPPGGEWRDGPINYDGYQETPVWNAKVNQWGFDFFAVWVPL